MRSSGTGEADTFGGWLLRQSGEEGWIGELASFAARDRTFPRHGSPADVYLHLDQAGADPDMHQAAQYAASKWRALTNRT
jgi:hypothetical protein